MITIRTVVEIEIVCDICSVDGGLFYADTKGEALAIARQAGWRIGKYHTCPPCSESSISPHLTAKAVKAGVELITLPPIRIV